MDSINLNIRYFSRKSYFGGYLSNPRPFWLFPPIYMVEASLRRLGLAPVSAWIVHCARATRVTSHQATYAILTFVLRTNGAMKFVCRMKIRHQCWWRYISPPLLCLLWRHIKRLLSVGRHILSSKARPESRQTPQLSHWVYILGSEIKYTSLSSKWPFDFAKQFRRSRPLLERPGGVGRQLILGRAETEIYCLSVSVSLCLGLSDDDENLLKCLLHHQILIFGSLLARSWHR